MCLDISYAPLNRNTDLCITPFSFEQGVGRKQMASQRLPSTALSLNKPKTLFMSDIL